MHTERNKKLLAEQDPVVREAEAIAQLRPSPKSDLAATGRIGAAKPVEQLK